MANDYFTPSGYPSTRASGSSSSMRTEINAVAAGFDKLPALTGNAYKIVYVNAAGTALAAVGGSGLLKLSASAIPSVAAAGTDYAPATSGSAILKGNGSGGFSAAAAGTDYAPATSGSAVLKGNGSGGFSAAASGTDYAPATSGSAILKGNGSGGFSAAASGSDYVAPGAATASGLTLSTARLLGRTTAGSGAIEEISVSGLTLSGGVLTSITLATPVTASGTSITFTDIPSGAKRIDVLFSGVSGSGTGFPRVLVGTSGGIATTGYNSAAVDAWSAGNVSTNSSSAEFAVRGSTPAAGEAMQGVLTIENISGNTWVCAGVFVVTGGASVKIASAAGTVTLGAALDRVQIGISGGDTFDGGTLNIAYS